MVATPENFKEYGTLLGETTASAGAASKHYAAVRVCNPSPNFASDADTCLLVLCYEPRPLECKFLERHYKHTQSFIPLEGKPLMGFFAPPNNRDEPDLDKVCCFVFDGSAGFVMHRGVWHEQPFPLEPATKAVCILRNETVRELKPTDVATSECHGEDIDKLNLQARHNLVFTADIADATSLLRSNESCRPPPSAWLLPERLGLLLCFTAMCSACAAVILVQSGQLFALMQ